MVEGLQRLNDYTFQAKVRGYTSENKDVFSSQQRKERTTKINQALCLPYLLQDELFTGTVSVSLSL